MDNENGNSQPETERRRLHTEPVVLGLQSQGLQQHNNPAAP
jgi:hypothetical protein